ncbi:MAG: type IV secretory system conjugative DNA transfer family protein [Fimbriimonas sp.]
MGLLGLLEAIAFLALGRGERRDSTPPTAEKGAEPGFLVGVSLPFGEESPEAGNVIRVPMPALTKHAAITGASGSGKSTAMHRLRDALVTDGIAVVDVDYRGDGLDRALQRLVAARVDSDRIAVIDLRRGDVSYPMNFLGHGPGDAHARAAIVYEALRETADSWGVQLGPDLMGALTALAEVRGSLLDVEPLLSPEGAAFRTEVAAKVTDEFASDFLAAYGRLPEDVQRQRLAAVSNKISPFVDHPALRASLGLPGVPDLAAMMDDPGRVTLVALGADRQPNARLIGRMLLAAIQRHAMARVDVPEADRNRVMLMVDEFQNVYCQEMAVLLAEGRRFRVGLIAALQFSGQIPAELRAALRTNTATQLYFHTSALEAAEISGEIVSSLPRDEIRKTLLTAPVGTAILVRRGQPAVLVKTPDSPDPKVDAKELERVREEAVRRVSVPRAEADLFLRERRERLRATHGEGEAEVRHERRPRTRGRNA